MQKWHTNIFTGGLNTDDDPTFMPVGDYNACEFLRNADSVIGYENALSTMLGNSLNSQTGLAFGSLPIGACEYPAINGFIVFYYSTIGSHSIWQWNGNNQTFTKLMESSVLDFKSDYYIGKNCKIIGNDLLVWSDGYFDSFLNTAGGLPRYHDVRCISISKALASGYTSITSQVLNLAKQPPEPPTCDYADDATISINNLYRHQFQFRVQFVYDNGEESSWSAISKVALQEGSEYWNGNKSTAYLNNTIEVEVPTGSYIVTAIRVATSVDGGPFGIFKELNKDDLGIGNDTSYTVVFTNTSSVLPVPDTTPNYYDVPQSALTIEAMPSGVMVFGNYYREFDLVDPAVTMAYNITEVTTTNRLYPQFKIEANTGTLVRTFKSLPVTGLPYMTGDVIFISYTYDASPDIPFTFQRAVQVGDFGVGTDAQKHINVITAFATAYNLASPPTAAAMIPGVPSFVLGFQLLTVPAKCYVLRDTYAVPTMKTGSRRQYGIKYLDVVNRECAVVTDPETMFLNILNPPEEDTSAFSDPNNPYYVVGDMTISHVPPEWATHWCVVTKDDGGIPSFMQVSAYEVMNYDQSPGLIRISINPQYTQYYFGATYNHNIQVGDQVRFRTKSVDTSTTPNTYHDKISETVTMTVRKYDPVGGYAGSEAIWVDIFDWGSLLDNNGNGTGTGALFEIFRPAATNDNNPWYEIGEWQNIRFPHTSSRAHEGNTQNQNGGTPAIQTMTFFDAWLRCRPMGVAIGNPAGMNWASYYVEDTRMSDFWDSNQTSRGRFAIYNINARRIYLESAVNHSFPYIQDTETNGLNKISLLTEKNLNTVYGAVTALTMSSNTLVVNQERHSLAIYTDSVLAANPGAGDTVLASPLAFGAVRYYEYLSGCVDPLTVIYDNGSVFWYDRTGGQVIENAGGGLIPISKGSYKFNREMTGLANEMNAGTRDLLFAFYDRQYNEYRLMACDTTPSTAWTGDQFVFSRTKRRWVRIDPLAVAWGIPAGNLCVTFDPDDGRSYTEGGGAEGEFFNVVRDYRIQFTVNPEPSLNKQFLSQGVKSVYTMDAEGTSYQDVLATGNQNTDWTSAWWQQIENTWWVQIPYAVDTPGFVDSDEARLNGNAMEGFYLLMALQGTPANRQVITFVRTGYFLRAPKL